MFKTALDVNERLFLSSLNRLLERKDSILCSVKEYQKEVGLDEGFFLETLRGLEKKNALEIGFRERTGIVIVKNWHTRYPARDDFYVKMTKTGYLQMK